MDFYIAMEDLGFMRWENADWQCQSYSFCGNVKGTLPTKDQLLTLYNNKSRVNSLLSTNGGTQLKNINYWSSTRPSPYGTDFYVVSMSNGNVNYYNNYDPTARYDVRPVLASW